MGNCGCAYVVSLLIGSLVLLGFAATVEAAPLDIILEDYPDITSGFIDITYDAGTDVFDASGFSLAYDDDGSVPSEVITGGTFNISATIDADGTLSAGTLAIGGTIPSLGYISGTLLTGTLTSLGFIPAGGDPLEFLFDVEITGGDLAPEYAGHTCGVILGGTNFPGSFAASFNNLFFDMEGTGQGVSDTGVVVPEPATLGLLVFGLMASRLRRRSKQ